MIKQIDRYESKSKDGNPWLVFVDRFGFITACQKGSVFYKKIIEEQLEDFSINGRVGRRQYIGGGKILYKYGNI